GDAQSNLAQIGIPLEAEGTTFPAQATTMQKVETTADINMLYVFPTFPDPHAGLNTTYNGALVGYKGGYNWADYSNPDVDKLLNEAAASSDPDKRADLYM